MDVPTSRRPSAFAVATESGLERHIYPAATGGSEATCSSDYWDFNAFYPCLRFGGDYDRDGNRGLFYVNHNSVSYADANVGCRLQKLP